MRSYVEYTVLSSFQAPEVHQIAYNLYPKLPAHIQEIDYDWEADSREP